MIFQKHHLWNPFPYFTPSRQVVISKQLQRRRVSFGLCWYHHEEERTGILWSRRVASGGGGYHLEEERIIWRGGIICGGGYRLD
jgi:hypothetical protein